MQHSEPLSYLVIDHTAMSEYRSGDMMELARVIDRGQAKRNVWTVGSWIIDEEAKEGAAERVRALGSVREWLAPAARHT